jgi:hypothetical protein
VLSTANKTNPVRKLVSNQLAAEQLAKRVAQPTALNAAKRAAALVPVAGAMQAGGGEGPQSLPSIRNMGPETGVYGAIPGRPGTEVYAGVDAPAIDAPIPTPSPDAALKRGLIGGEAVAQDRNQGNLLSGLLGDIDYKGILNQLVKTFQRPEMLTPGVNALTSFGMSGAALNQAEMAGAAAEQERMDKFAMEQIKNAPGATKPTTEITNLYKEMGVYQSGLNTFDKIKSILSEGIGTGVAGSTLNGLTNIAAAFNINLSPSAKKSINLAVAEIRTQLIASRAYGREANKDEQKLIRTLIPEAGTFSTIKELEEAYNNAAASMRRKANETNAIMTGVYGLKSYGSIVPNSPLFTRDNK